MRAALLAVALAWAAPAQACGYCVEDKIAAVYDHALVTRAVGRGQHVVFFHVDGALPAGESGRRALTGAAQATSGVERGTVRVSADNLTLSFAFDPGRRSLAALQGELDKRLAARGLALLPLRVIERPAEMKAVAR